MTNTHIQASQAALDRPVRNREETSSRQVAKEAKFGGPANMAEKKAEKTVLYDFQVHDCSQEQNGSPNFSFIV